MSKKIIIGNWKLNPTTGREAKELLAKVRRQAVKTKNVVTVVCPPTIWIGAVAPFKSTKNFVLGGQDCFSEVEGAFTGQTSSAMLRDSGVQYVILGHSERRAAGDGDELINQKIRTALKSGLTVVLCVGETVRDDHGVYLETIKEQLLVGLAKLPKPAFGRIVIAYEPVWAIGDKATGADTPEAFVAQKIYIRKILSHLAGSKEAMKVPVIYGGSVGAKNANDFLTTGQADGLLVGRSSLRADLFNEIITIADHGNKTSKK